MSREKQRSRLPPPPPPTPQKRRIDEVSWSGLHSGKARRVAVARGNQRHNVVKVPLGVIGQCSLLEGARGGPWFVEMGCIDYWWLLGALANINTNSKGNAVHQWLGTRSFVTALHGASDDELADLVEVQELYQDWLMGAGGMMPRLLEYEAYMDGDDLVEHGWPAPELGRWYELRIQPLDQRTEYQNSWMRQQNEHTLALGSQEPCILNGLTRLPDHDPNPIVLTQSLLDALHTPLGQD
ncbi:MAG: hypothetical protein H6712_32135 [Myxococcales bacterium]|nr:hypothetical protein [Myxococcales bacterium]MCB9718544.1 hypothetical protein [Myxococcales bacterium]